MSLHYCAYHARLLTKTKQVLARIMVAKFAYSLQTGQSLNACEGRHGLLKCGLSLVYLSSAESCMAMSKSRKHQSTHKADAYKHLTVEVLNTNTRSLNISNTNINTV